MAPSRRAEAARAARLAAGETVLRRRVDRLREAVEEQGSRCFWCGRPFSDLVRATTDHVVPRVKGGPSWRENEVAACRRCNAERGHTGPAEWLEECHRRGWPSDRNALQAHLRRLEEVIVERGGQRRARPYLRSQRRRLANAEHAGGPAGSDAG